MIFYHGIWDGMRLMSFALWTSDFAHGGCPRVSSNSVFIRKWFCPSTDNFAFEVFYFVSAFCFCIYFSFLIEGSLMSPKYS